MKRQLNRNLTLEQLCERLSIKGLVHYTETERYIQIKNYLYNKATGTLWIDACTKNWTLKKKCSKSIDK